MKKIFAFLAGMAVGAAITARFYRAAFAKVCEGCGEHKNAIDIPDDRETTDPESGMRLVLESEFGENEDYETCTLFFHNDGTLTDSSNEPFGVTEDELSFIERFFENCNEGEDVIYFRNDKLKAYYEVLFDGKGDDTK
ncbi:MAG: hypothetical protein NC078_08405 [Ruminococcus sp.]|nr:hypothetical protein [Ruminococcus sp.]